MLKPHVLVKDAHELISVVPISGTKQGRIIKFFSLQNLIVKVQRLRLTEAIQSQVGVNEHPRRLAQELVQP